MSNSPSSTPDIASLSLSSKPSRQRIHDSYDYEGNGGNGGARSQYHYSTSPPIPAQSQYNPLTLNQSPLKNKTMRGGLPSQWLDNPIPDSRSLSPHNNSDLSSTGGSPPASQINAPTTPVQGNDDEVIPTAIVIKNIPFNVKRETLLDIIASLSIPTPYAFNYHLDQSGQFRGLAFANFRAASDADAVVAALNGFDVQGRKLRVEYKKVLQAGEKERIEREKAIRRMRSMQLEKEQQQQQQAVPSMPPYDDFGPVMPPTFPPQRSFSGQYVSQQQQYSPPQLAAISGLSPPFLNTNVQQLQSMISPLAASPGVKSPSNELDLNDPSTLDIYSRILLFKDDHMRDELAFSRTLSPKQRRVVHLIAQKLGVYHYSVGEGDERYAVVTRIDPATRQQPRHTLSRAPSAYLTPTGTTPPTNLLRGKKSMPDMKSLQNPVPRLNTRSSNGNIREGYATIASPSRRSPGGFGSLFSGNGFGNGSIPPVPSLPSSVQNGMAESPTIMRQPRGPGVGGFESRRERVTASESQVVRPVDARSHEPLEI